MTAICSHCQWWLIARQHQHVSSRRPQSRCVRVQGRRETRPDESPSQLSERRNGSSFDESCQSPSWATSAHRSALISVSVALSETPAEAATYKSTDTGPECRVECLFSSQLKPVPIYTAWRQVYLAVCCMHALETNDFERKVSILDKKWLRMVHKEKPFWNAGRIADVILSHNRQHYDTEMVNLIIIIIIIWLPASCSGNIGSSEWIGMRISQQPRPENWLSTQATIGRLAFCFNVFLFWFSVSTRFC